MIFTPSSMSIDSLHIQRALKLRTNVHSSCTQFPINIISLVTCSLYKGSNQIPFLSFFIRQSPRLQ